jgi:polyhydroxyalkanoate synthesis regulator phasin
MMGKYLDQWLVASAPMKKAAEQQIDQALQTLNMASRSQLTAVAKQIVELEERLERMEDTLGAILQRLDHKEPK